jgi:hypothetical protein
MTATAGILRLPSPAAIGRQSADAQRAADTQPALQDAPRAAQPPCGQAPIELHIPSAPFVAQVIAQYHGYQEPELDLRLYGHPGFAAYQGADALLAARAQGFSARA